MSASGVEVRAVCVAECMCGVWMAYVEEWVVNGVVCGPYMGCVESAW